MEGQGLGSTGHSGLHCSHGSSVQFLHTSMLYPWTPQWRCKRPFNWFPPLGIIFPLAFIGLRNIIVLLVLIFTGFQHFSCQVKNETAKLTGSTSSVTKQGFSLQMPTQRKTSKCLSTVLSSARSEEPILHFIFSQALNVVTV